MKHERKSDAKRTLQSFKNMRYSLVLEGLLVGTIAGAVAIAYRLLLGYSEDILQWVLSFCRQSPWAVVGWFAILLLLALCVGKLLKWEPMISGSGIPQVEGELTGHLNQSWWRVLTAKIAAGTLCILGGLSLGREGPSIQLGGMTGKAVSKALKRTKVEERHLITCGASAGLAAAFNAPLAGIMFALEEIHKNFSVTVLFSVMTASVVADFVSQYVFGLSPVFQFPVNSLIPLSCYWLIVILGVLLGIGGAIYNKATVNAQSLYEKIKWLKPHLRPVIPFFLAGILGFTMPQVLGSGHRMVDLLTNGSLLLPGVLILLLVKFLFSLASFGSGAPGGIFFPLLVLGAYIGGGFGMAAVSWLGLDPALVNNFIILAMAGFFTAIVRAPITGIVLITEMTGTLSHLLSLTVVSVVAYITADLLKSAPIYDSLLERILKKQGTPTEGNTREKVLIESVVQHGSGLEQKFLRDITWPEACLIVAIRRGEKEIIPHGETLLFPSDTLVALVNDFESAKAKAELDKLCAQSGSNSS